MQFTREREIYGYVYMDIYGIYIIYDNMEYICGIYMWNIYIIYVWRYTCMEFTGHD